MPPTEAVLELPLWYRLWQAPFAEQKLVPLFAYNDIRRAKRVLDVGCGPGTNTKHFTHADYLGVDVNARYIAYAHRRYERHFLAADVTTYTVAVGQQFDFILANSFFHHINTANTRRILAHLGTLLTDDGCIHILDLVMPERPSIARLLARWDRGHFARALTTWREIFEEAFDPVVFESYPLTAFGTTLWNMVYFKGRARR